VAAELGESLGLESGVAQSALRRGGPSCGSNFGAELGETVQPPSERRALRSDRAGLGSSQGQADRSKPRVQGLQQNPLNQLRCSASGIAPCRGRRISRALDQGASRATRVTQPTAAGEESEAQGPSSRARTTDPTRLARVPPG